MSGEGDEARNDAWDGREDEQRQDETRRDEVRLAPLVVGAVTCHMTTRPTTDHRPPIDRPSTAHRPPTARPLLSIIPAAAASSKSLDNAVDSGGDGGSGTCRGQIAALG